MNEACFLVQLFYFEVGICSFFLKGLGIELANRVKKAAH